MSKVVCSHTIVYPRAMAEMSVYTHNESSRSSLIKFRNTTVAFPAVFASQWHPQHAMDAEVLFIVFPQAEEFIHDPLLLASAC